MTQRQRRSIFRTFLLGSLLIAAVSVCQILGWLNWLDLRIYDLRFAHCQLHPLPPTQQLRPKSTGGDRVRWMRFGYPGGWRSTLLIAGLG
jgi:hypothetical protein